MSKFKIKYNFSDHKVIKITIIGKITYEELINRFLNIYTKLFYSHSIPLIIDIKNTNINPNKIDIISLHDILLSHSTMISISKWALITQSTIQYDFFVKFKSLWSIDSKNIKTFNDIELAKNWLLT